jgi:hypothetical protein
MNDGHVEKVGLTKPQYHGRENEIKTAAGLPPSKGTINTGVMNLGASFGVLCNRQFLPLTSQVQQFQDVIEQGMQGQLRRRTTASHGQVRQDKLSELLEAQFRRNAQASHAFRHFNPPDDREPVANQAAAPKPRNVRSLLVGPTCVETRNQ